ncbi:MAG: phosphoribosyltransferase [Flavobacteriales bacterium]|nr:phosphoribosyltransferase [Flavobacteriales bacterium]
MTTEKTLILSTERLHQKLNRIAHEIHENHFEDKELIIIGIADRGYIFAKLLTSVLTKISDLDISLHKLKIEKKGMLKEINKQELEKAQLSGKVVLLVDDVLNSGKTLAYGVKHILDYPVKRLCTVVMVNRRHRLYPVRADYVGLTLATTIKEHINVDLQKGKEVVYLS